MRGMAKHPSHIIYFHIKRWRFGANMNERKSSGETPNPEKEVEGFLTEPGPEDTIGLCINDLHSFFLNTHILDSGTRH